jgi:hypothetical protein
MFKWEGQRAGLDWRAQFKAKRVATRAARTQAAIHADKVKRHAASQAKDVNVSIKAAFVNDVGNFAQNEVLRVRTFLPILKFAPVASRKVIGNFFRPLKNGQIADRASQLNLRDFAGRFISCAIRAKLSVKAA